MDTGNWQVRFLIQSPQLLGEIRTRDDLGAPFCSKRICVVHDLLETTVGVLRYLLACIGAQYTGDGCMRVFGACIAETLNYGVPGFSSRRSGIFGSHDDIGECGANPEKSL